jgi:hypothetical protein
MQKAKGKWQIVSWNQYITMFGEQRKLTMDCALQAGCGKTATRLQRAIHSKQAHFLTETGLS